MIDEKRKIEGAWEVLKEREIKNLTKPSLADKE